MMILRNEGIEKDDNDKNKQYQKREDIIFSFFRKPRKIRVLNMHSICNCSNHLFSVSYGYGFDLTFPGIFS